MGLDPAAQHRPAFEETLRSDGYLDYVMAALHLNDQRFLQRLADWYRTNQWDSALKKGEKIVEIIMQHKSIDSQVIIPIFVQCLNVLKQGIVKFELYRWRDTAKGNHLEHAAIIRILPLRVDSSLKDQWLLQETPKRYWHVAGISK